MTTVAAADMACLGVVLESGKQDMASRLSVAGAYILERDSPLVRAQWEWQENGHGVAMRLIEITIRRDEKVEKI